MYRSANASRILPKIRFIQNGVDEVRRKAVFRVDKFNNGGSYVKLPQTVINEENPKEQELVETVLLSDILDAAEAIEDPKQVIMKIDIELFECRAFLGSSNVFRQPQVVPITAIIMEWIYKGGDGRFSDRCPEDKMRLMAKMLLDTGYVPYSSFDLRRLNYSHLGEEWSGNVLWLLNGKPPSRFRKS